LSHAIQGIFATVNLSDVFLLIRAVGMSSCLRSKHFWWGEAPGRRYDLTKALVCFSRNIWLHKYARRAAAYRVAR
jgi:hypothetical protein